MLTKIDTTASHKSFITAKPFHHVVIDDFFDEGSALALSKEFPDFHDPLWFVYNNPLEKKKTCNEWNRFPRNIYSTLTYLNSPQFIAKLKKITGIKKLYPDVGLHGGGLHIHGKGDKLNVHLDYSIHPKLKLQRKINLIIYLGEGWNPEWGGQLELWSADKKECITSVDTLFNRAIIFDTTQKSYHGLPTPLSCPDDCYRKSLAVYYLTDAPENCPTNSKAIYIPTKEQEDDKEIQEIIEKRSRMTTAKQGYQI